jgi:hypothetical protein
MKYKLEVKLIKWNIVFFISSIYIKKINFYLAQFYENVFINIEIIWKY